MKNILLVEDDAALGRGIALALRGDDVRISLRESCAGALEAAEREEFDLAYST